MVLNLLETIGTLMNKKLMEKQIDKILFPCEEDYHKPLLSIIVPVYNVENYLRRCLNTVVNQTLDSSIFEIIIIDDKSTDGSVQIEEEFAVKYSNIRLIKLDKNTPGGAGIPSNIGIKLAKGDYIGFVDSDDFVEPFMFEEMLKKAILNEADLVVCDFAIFNEKTFSLSPSYDKKKFKNFCKTVDKKSNNRTQKNSLLSLSAVPWRKLYKKSFLQENSIKYPEGNFFFEDNPLHWFVATLAKTVVAVDRVLIYHRIFRPGQTIEASSNKLLAFPMHGRIIKKFLTEKGILEDYKTEFVIWLLEQSNWVIPKLGQYETKYLEDVDEILNNIEIKFLMFDKWGSYGPLRSVYMYIMFKNWKYLASPMSKLYKFIFHR